MPDAVSHPRARWAVFGLALGLGLVADLGTKALAFAALPESAPHQPVTEFFAFHRAFNTGAAFGAFDGALVVFLLVAMGAFVAIPYIVHTARRRPLATGLVLGLILAGVAGNFWDRAVYGGVRDFLDVHAPPGDLRAFCVATFGTYVWPTFNVADLWIVGGALVVLGHELFAGEAPATATTEGEPADGGPLEAGTLRAGLRWAFGVSWAPCPTRPR